MELVIPEIPLAYVNRAYKSFSFVTFMFGPNALKRNSKDVTQLLGKIIKPQIVFLKAISHYKIEDMTSEAKKKEATQAGKYCL